MTTENMNTRVLDFELAPVQNLTLAELQLSVSEVSTGGRNVHGIEHHQIWTQIADGLDKAEVSFEIGEIMATDGGSKAFRGVNHIPMLEETYGKKTIQATILRRVMGGIFFIGHGASPTNTGGLAISYHQDGVQLAYGQHIHLCRNWTIMTYQNMMSSFGPNKMPIDKMIELAITWGEQNGPRREFELSVIDKMNHTILNQQDVAQMIGELTFSRIGRDVLRTTKSYPLNQTQINQLAEDYLRMVNPTAEDENPDEISLWKFYNMITDRHKPGQTEIPLILENNVATAAYILNRYGIAYPKSFN